MEGSDRELLKDDIIEGRNLIEEIIEETFVVSNDIFREDRVKIIKEVLKIIVYLKQ